MRVATLVAIGLVAVATPALAGQGKKSQWHATQCRNISVGNQECTPAQRADRFNVYSYDGRLIGRDPDANVRMQLRDDDAFLRSR